MRLQKYLADSGVTSRRHAESYILEGRVLVNGEVVDTIPSFVTPGEDEVRFNGSVVRPQQHAYFLINKPTGIVCTQRDPGGRMRVVDLLPEGIPRVYPVGRLDVDSSGLLLLTNDGELAAKVSHPSYGLPKVYRVEVKGEVPRDIVAQMRKGVYLSDGRARASEVTVVHHARDRSVLELTLREGRNRQIRRMLARLGHPVKTLKRIRIGPLEVRRLPDGACRRLSGVELDRLLDALETARAEAAANRPRRTRRRGRPAERDGGPRRPEPARETKRKRRIVN